MAEQQPYPLLAILVIIKVIRVVTATTLILMAPLLLFLIVVSHPSPRGTFQNSVAGIMLVSSFVAFGWSWPRYLRAKAECKLGAVIFYGTLPALTFLVPAPLFYL